MQVYRLELQRSRSLLDKAPGWLTGKWGLNPNLPTPFQALKSVLFTKSLIYTGGPVEKSNFV